MKKIVTVIILCFVAFTGCVMQKQASLVDIECVTFLSCVPDPASYEVYVIEPDGVVKYYDFTAYWLNNEFDYYTQPLPPEADYVMTQVKLAENGWKEIVASLEESQFGQLPETMEPERGYDLPSYEIEVKTKDNILRVGGYGAGLGEDSKSKRFAAVLETIQKCINSSLQSR